MLDIIEDSYIISSDTDRFCFFEASTVDITQYCENPKHCRFDKLLKNIQKYTFQLIGAMDAFGMLFEEPDPLEQTYFGWYEKIGDSFGKMVRYLFDMRLSPDGPSDIHEGRRSRRDPRI